MEIFSEYFKKNLFLSKVDARVKLGMSLLIIVMVLSYKGLVFPLFILCISLAVCIGIKIPLKTFLIRFSGPLFIAFVVILLKFLFSGHDTIPSMAQ